MSPLKWTPEEEKILRSLYPNPSLTIDEIADGLPGRSQNAIRVKAHGMKLHRPLLPGFCPSCGRPLPSEEDQAAAEACPRGAPIPAGRAQAG